jgi:hypothetical protein
MFIDVEAIFSWLRNTFDYVVYTMIVFLPIYIFMRVMGAITIARSQGQLKELLREILSGRWWIMQIRRFITELPLLVLSVAFLVFWMFTSDKMHLFLGLFFLMIFIDLVSRDSHLRFSVRDVLVFLYSFAAVSTIFFIREIGLNVLQLPIEVVYLIMGSIVIVYIVFGYKIFIRKRK